MHYLKHHYKEGKRMAMKDNLRREPINNIMVRLYSNLKSLLTLVLLRSFHVMKILGILTRTLKLLFPWYPCGMVPGRTPRDNSAI